MRLAAFLSGLDAFKQPIPLAELSRRVEGLDISLEDVRRWAKFSDTCYLRNSLHMGPAYQALILCWRSGQRSPIHDHRGSACVVRVLEGVATESVFERSAAGLIYPTISREWATQSVCASFDADIHQMGNLQPAGTNLVTLHIYSPPLLTMQTYYLGDAVTGESEAGRSAARARATHGVPQPTNGELGAAKRTASVKRRARTALR